MCSTPTGSLDNYRTLARPAGLSRLLPALADHRRWSRPSSAWICAWPVAYFIARYGGRYRLLLVLLLAAPFFTGIILRIAALQGLLGPSG